MKKIIASVLTCILFLSGCYPPGTPDATGMYAPHFIIGANVPFADSLHTYQWDHVKLLEEDAYGRRYYAYTTSSLIVQSKILIHVICQAETEDSEYGYYQDLCYIVQEADGDSFSDAQIARLKAQNDWNRPIDKEKIGYVAYGAENATSQSEASALFKRILLEYLDLNSSLVVINNEMEQVAPNVQLSFVRIVTQDLKDLSTDRFFFVLHNTKPYSIIVCEEVGFSWDYQDVIRQLRKNWSFSK